MFDYITAILDKFEDLFKTTLEVINLKLMYMNETEENKNKYLHKQLNELLLNSKESKRKSLRKFKDFANQNNSLDEDIKHLVESLSVLFLKFHDTCFKFNNTLFEE